MPRNGYGKMRRNVKIMRLDELGSCARFVNQIHTKRLWQRRSITSYCTTFHVRFIWCLRTVRCCFIWRFRVWFGPTLIHLLLLRVFSLPISVDPNRATVLQRTRALSVFLDVDQFNAEIIIFDMRLHVGGRQYRTYSNRSDGGFVDR